MWGNETPQFRHVPVNAEVVSEGKVLPWDNAMNLIDPKDPNHIALLPCPRREIFKTLG